MGGMGAQSAGLVRSRWAATSGSQTRSCRAGQLWHRSSTVQYATRGLSHGANHVAPAHYVGSLHTSALVRGRSSWHQAGAEGTVNN